MTFGGHCPKATLTVPVRKIPPVMPRTLSSLLDTRITRSSNGRRVAGRINACRHPSAGDETTEAPRIRGPARRVPGLAQPGPRANHAYPDVSPISVADRGAKCKVLYGSPWVSAIEACGHADRANAVIAYRSTPLLSPFQGGQQGGSGTRSREPLLAALTSSLRDATTGSTRERPFGDRRRRRSFPGLSQAPSRVSGKAKRTAAVRSWRFRSAEARVLRSRAALPYVRLLLNCQTGTGEQRGQVVERQVVVVVVRSVAKSQTAEACVDP